MNKLVIDAETSSFQTGNPFSRRNHCCCVALCKDGSSSVCIPWEHGGNPVSADNVQHLQAAINEANLLIGFAFKFDLHWLRRCGIIVDYANLPRVWDCQVAQFIIQCQQERYPSLDSSCAFFGLGQKSKVVEEEFWNRGIDTDAVPWDILSEYAKRDVDLTWQLYEAQQKWLVDHPELKRLIKLSCMDTVVLAELEWNGLRYDVEESLRRAKDIEKELKDIDGSFESYLNLRSHEHVSALLYGGVVRWVEKTPAKDGRFKHTKIEKTLPRLVVPLEHTRLKKDGYWSTDDDTLKRLRVSGAAKKVVGLLIKRNKLERLKSTYYEGLPKVIEEKDWEPGTLHGQFNQTTVVTGRLSSSSPNLQNLHPEVDELIKSRFS